MRNEKLFQSKSNIQLNLYRKKNRKKKFFTIFFYLTISIFLIIIDYKSIFFVKFHKCINDIISLYYISLNKICQKKEYMANFYFSHRDLILENLALKEKIFLKETENLLFSRYELENQVLHALLNSSSDIFQKKMVARVIIGEKNLYDECNIIIDKGKRDGVHLGQSVINQKGIVGQVISVDKFTSRVALICNASYVLSVRVLRNNIHMLAVGEGSSTFGLYSDCLILNADVQKGDILVSTGFDDFFPKDYPVATVTYVKNDIKHGCTKIRSKPTVNFRQLDYLLLLFQKRDRESG